MDRRDFVQLFTAMAGTAALSGNSFSARANNSGMGLTIQQVIDLLLKEIPGAPFSQTVDTIKAGDASREVRGIITTMFATIPIIKQAAETGANFIIAHEPTFYNHADDVKMLELDRVYQVKKELLDRHGITVWRCHDYIHAYRPDGVLTGVLKALQWQSYAVPSKPYTFEIPASTLSNIIQHCKKKLDITQLRYIGRPESKCKRVVLMPGAAGGRRQINSCTAEKPDLIIVGEVAEWETPEYIRDAQAAGFNMNLIVLGHIPSEAPGGTWLAEWLKPRLNGIPVRHIEPEQSMKWA